MNWQDEVFIFLSSLLPWWVVIMLIPAARFWWDLLEDARFARDRDPKKGNMSIGEAKNARKRRTIFINSVMIFTTIICTLFATSAATFLNKNIENQVEKNTKQLDSFNTSEIKHSIQLVKDKVSGAEEEIDSLQQTKVDQSDYDWLYNCVNQLANELEEDADCFPFIKE